MYQERFNNQILRYENNFTNYYGRTYPEIKDHEFVLAFYGSHNGSVVIAQGKKILEVIEFERFWNYKNSGLTAYKTPRQSLIYIYVDHLKKYLSKQYGANHFRMVLAQENCININNEIHHIEQEFPADYYFDCIHHYSHASSVFYQSTFTQALAITSDGGGNDGVFNFFLMRRGQDPEFIAECVYDLGFAYMSFGEYLGDIRKENSLSDGNLVYAGKIMGLVSYGNVKHAWLPYFVDYYKSLPNGTNYTEKIQKLWKQIHLDLGPGQRITGQIAYDIAATSQRAFEDLFFEVVYPFLKMFPDLPICFSGGCALNILLNTRIINERRRCLFVGPNPNDCGIALGMMLDYIRPSQSFTATYTGIPILDPEMLLHYIQDEGYSVSKYSLTSIARHLQNGKIFGLVQGRAEHGPRALGNRSIICDPSIPDMKDRLNQKVKHREWYRPFAPVVREEDVAKYFEFNDPSPFMNVAVRVRDQYQNQFPSITHIDSTARVQTVNKEQNKLLYDLLCEFTVITGHGVLVNTSFNVDGKPISSTLRDVFTVLKTTELDGVIYEDLLILK